MNANISQSGATAVSKIIYCPKCKEKTAHKFVATSDNAVGDGLVRFIFAIGTMGISEMCRVKHYSCGRCGKIYSTKGNLQ